MNKDIANYNNKGELHGFQCIYDKNYYDGSYKELAARGNFKNNSPSGYYETHHNDNKNTFYFIL